MEPSPRGNLRSGSDVVFLYEVADASCRGECEEGGLVRVTEKGPIKISGTLHTARRTGRKGGRTCEEPWNGGSAPGNQVRREICGEKGGGRVTRKLQRTGWRAVKVPKVTGEKKLGIKPGVSWLRLQIGDHMQFLSDDSAGLQICLRILKSGQITPKEAKEEKKLQRDNGWSKKDV